MLVVDASRPVCETHGESIIVKDVEPVTIVLVLKGNNSVALKNSSRGDVDPCKLLVVKDNSSNIGTSGISSISCGIVSQDDAADEDLTANTLTIVPATRNLNERVDGRETGCRSERLGEGKVVDFATGQEDIPVTVSISLCHGEGKEKMIFRTWCFIDRPAPLPLQSRSGPRRLVDSPPDRFTDGKG